MTDLSTVVTTGRPPDAGRAGAARPGWTLALAGMGAFISALDIVVVATGVVLSEPLCFQLLRNRSRIPLGPSSVSQESMV